MIAFDQTYWLINKKPPNGGFFSGCIIVFMNRFMSVITQISMLVLLTQGLLYPLGRTFVPSTKVHGDFLRIINEDETGIILNYSFPEFSFEKANYAGSEYNKLSINGIGQVFEYNKPYLPKVSELIAVPGNCEVKLTIIYREKIGLPGPFTLMGPSEPTPIQDDFTGGTYSEKLIDPDPTIDKTYPESIASIASDAWIRDQRVILLEVFPFQYIMSSGDLIWNREVRVEISFNYDQENETDGWSQTNINPYEEYLRKNLVNYHTATLWRGFPEQKIEYELNTSSEGIESLSLLPDQSDKIKIEIEQDGLYKLTKPDMVSMGLGGINPNDLTLTSQGVKHAYYLLNDDGDEIFDDDEQLIFWGEKYTGNRFEELYGDEDANWGTFTRQLPDGTYDNWTPQLNAVMFEKYTDTNVYWLDWESGFVERMEEISGVPGGQQPSMDFQQKKVFEEDNVWRTHPFTSESTWFWERIQSNDVVDREYDFRLENPLVGQNIVTFNGEIMAVKTNDGSLGDHHISIFINEGTSPVFDGWWDGKSRYHFSFVIPSATIFDGTNSLRLRVHPTENVPVEDLFFDWFSVEYGRYLTAVDNQLHFATNSVSDLNYEVNGFSNQDIWIIDLGQTEKPKFVSNFDIQLTSSGIEKYH